MTCYICDILLSFLEYLVSISVVCSTDVFCFLFFVLSIQVDGNKSILIICLPCGSRVTNLKIDMLV